VAETREASPARLSGRGSPGLLLPRRVAAVCLGARRPGEEGQHDTQQGQAGEAVQRDVEAAGDLVDERDPQRPDDPPRLQAISMIP
jgi:hypothetical protein